jgi:hypothetical protein
MTMKLPEIPNSIRSMILWRTDGRTVSTSDGPDKSKPRSEPRRRTITVSTGFTAGFSRSEPSGSQARQAATEAIAAVPPAIQAVIRQSEEVHLLTDAPDVVTAVDAYAAALTSYDPSAAHTGNEDRSAQGIELTNRLAAGCKGFAIAARRELQIAILPTGTPPRDYGPPACCRPSLSSAPLPMMLPPLADVAMERAAECHHCPMKVSGDPAMIPRMLLVGEVRFDPDQIFALDRPLFLMPGDLVWMDGAHLTIRRVSGQEERPPGEASPWCWQWRLL